MTRTELTTPEEKLQKLEKELLAAQERIRYLENRVIVRLRAILAFTAQYDQPALGDPADLL